MTRSKLTEMGKRADVTKVIKKPIGDKEELLELKHLAPYLPYELKIWYKLIVVDMQELSINNIDKVLEDSKHFKPILRPLSDLTKDDLDTLQCTELYNQINDADFCIHLLPYQIAMYLIENHFDVFGLIEKGLAIDINTLNK